MNSAEEYFNQVQQLIDHTPDAVIERYEEQLLSETRGVLRIRLRFPDDALLEKRKGSKKYCSYNVRTCQGRSSSPTLTNDRLSKEEGPRNARQGRKQLSCARPGRSRRTAPPYRKESLPGC